MASVSESTARTSGSGALPSGFTLEPGERLLWASRTSGTAGYPQWAIALIVLAVFFGGGPVIGMFVAMLSLLSVPLDALSPMAILFVTSLPPLLVMGLALGAYLVPRARLSHFLTSRRLVSRGLFGGLSSLRLDQVRNVDRLVVRYRTRYGVREVVTDRLRLVLDGGREFLFGPSRDIDRVLDLIENGVLTKWVDLSTLPALALPGLPAPPTPAESHADFFLCATTRTEGDGYGPLFVGPRLVVRITEELPFHVLGRLYTLMAKATDGAAAEAALFEIVRLSVVGHFVELPRSGTMITFDGGNVVFAGDAGQRHEMRLPGGAEERLKTYAKRPVPQVESAPQEDASLSARLSGRAARGAPSAASTASAPSTASTASMTSTSRRADVEASIAGGGRGPDLDDPTVSESAARTLLVGGLSASHRKELIAALGSERRVFFAPARFLAERRATLALAALTPLFLLLAVGTRFGQPCTPTQDAVWIVAYALGLSGPAFALMALALHLLRSRSLPFTPGLYVFPRDVVVARGNALRIVPLVQVAAVGGAKPMPLSKFGELTLWIEGEPAESAFVPGGELDELVARVEAAREAAHAGAYRTAVPDPLAELRRTDVLDKAPRARPPSETPRLLIGALVCSFVLGAGVFPIRNALSDQAALSNAGDDTEALTCYADAEGRDAERVRTVLLPHAAYVRAHEAGSVNALTDFLTAYPDAADAETARHEREELAWSTASNDVWSLSAFIAAHPDSGHVAEARRMLPSLALRDAREQDDVASLTSVIRTYPGTPEAATATELRHARYVTALESLRARGGRSEVLRYFDRLFTYLEAHDAPEVLVRFRPPSATSLTALDELLARQNGGNVEAIAPSFSPRPSRLRETIVYDRLRDGFRGVIAADVLPLDHGARLPEPLTEAEIAARIAADADLGASTEELASLAASLRENNDPPALGGGTAPEIRIFYEVVPTGDVYALEGGPTYYGAPEPDRHFAGFRVDFTVELRLGSEPERPVLRFSVTPPQSLMVGDIDPSASTIYERLATAAFDSLGSELTGAFFGAAP